MSIISGQIDPYRIFSTRVLKIFFELIYAYLNEGDKVRECYGCLKMMIQTNLHIGFITIFSFTCTT